MSLCSISLVICFSFVLYKTVVLVMIVLDYDINSLVWTVLITRFICEVSLGYFLLSLNVADSYFFLSCSVSSSSEYFLYWTQVFLKKYDLYIKIYLVLLIRPERSRSVLITRNIDTNIIWEYLLWTSLIVKISCSMFEIYIEYFYVL